MCLVLNAFRPHKIRPILSSGTRLSLSLYIYVHNRQRYNYIYNRDREREGDRPFHRTLCVSRRHNTSHIKLDLQWYRACQDTMTKDRYMDRNHMNCMLSKSLNMKEDPTGTYKIYPKLGPVVLFSVQYMYMMLYISILYYIYHCLFFIREVVPDIVLVLSSPGHRMWRRQARAEICPDLGEEHAGHFVRISHTLPPPCPRWRALRCKTPSNSPRRPSTLNPKPLLLNDHERMSTDSVQAKRPTHGFRFDCAFVAPKPTGSGISHPDGFWEFPKIIL